MRSAGPPASRVPLDQTSKKLEREFWNLHTSLFVIRYSLFPSEFWILASVNEVSDQERATAEIARKLSKSARF